jgi:tRNA pseudouridine13 synthase
MSPHLAHEREQDDADIERYSKRPKVGGDVQEPSGDGTPTSSSAQTTEHILPPSHALLGIAKPVAEEGSPLKFLEADVGISEYIGRGEAKIEGIIKQRSALSLPSVARLHINRDARFTDFLVYEIDQDGKVLHLESLGKPESSKKGKEPKSTSPLNNSEDVVMSVLPDEGSTTAVLDKEKAEGFSTSNLASTEAKTPNSENKLSSKEDPWPEHFDVSLSAFLDGDKITELKRIYLEGPEPPRVSDNGWAGRVAGSKGEDVPDELVEIPDAQIGMDNRRGRGGKRGGRGAGRGGRADRREDARKVLSEVNLVPRSFIHDLTCMKQPIASKDTRTAFHKTIRDLFGGKLETETDASMTGPIQGSCIIIKWARWGSGRGGRGVGSS